MPTKTALACVLAALAGMAGPSGDASRPVQQKPHPCAAAAAAQAGKLLVFHIGPDDRITIDPLVRSLAPLRNPANRAQRFDVLEVWAHVYKGQYRMRFIYARPSGECVLMGQEILEYADL
jgi:hypothetical protein